MTRIKDVVGAALLFLINLIVYFPALQGTPLWDDNTHITSTSLQTFEGLWRIWFRLGSTQQYYPLLHSAFWLEHRLWGDSVLGYHLINVALHSLAAFLVVRIVRELGLPGEWLAGSLFALHPVSVESVAWISEQKNTLSAVFYLTSGLVYLGFSNTRKPSRYWIAFGLFVLALLTKSVTASLPAALLLIFWWQRGRLEWKKDVVPLIPWLGLGAGSGAFTAWVERTYVGAYGTAYSLSLVDHFLLAGRILCFYLWKLFWPSNLIFIYPHWTIDATVWWQYLFPIGFIVLLVSFSIIARRQRGPLAAILFFTGTLFPVLGFLNVYPFIYSYVADHFQYLASLGLIVPAAALLIRVGERFGKESRYRKAVIIGFVPIVFAVMSSIQSGMYADARTLWRETIDANPGSSLANNNLGVLLFQEGREDEAMPYFEKALDLDGNYADANANMGNVLRFNKKLDQAITYYRKATVLRPNVASYHGSLANALVDADQMKEAALEYGKALEIEPSHGLIANNLAWILATSPDPSLRNGPRAVELATRAVDSLGPDPISITTLAASYAEAGRFEEAVSTAQRAQNLAIHAGNLKLADFIQTQVNLYRSNRPFHGN